MKHDRGRKDEMRQQNTDSESNREPEIDTPTGFPPSGAMGKQDARTLPLAGVNSFSERSSVLFRYKRAVTLMQKVHRLTHN